MANLSLALLLMLAAPLAGAVGLGESRLRSALGEPLDVGIELFPEPYKASELRVRLATPEQYRSFGMYWYPGLKSARVAIEPTGRPSARIRTAAPVKEPALELLVEVSWAGGRLLRDYVLLLEPPAVTAPETTRQTSPAAPAGGGHHRVRRGDTLGSIAAHYADSAGVSPAQMTAALFRSNPDAFLGGNMNRLKAGVRLRVPDAEAASRLGETEALALIAEHAAAWKERRPVSAGRAAPATGTAPAGRPMGDGGTARAVPAETVPTARRTGDAADRAADPAPRSREAALALLAPGAGALDEAPTDLREKMAVVRRYSELMQLRNQDLRERLAEAERRLEFIASQVLELAPAPPGRAAKREGESPDGRGGEPPLAQDRGRELISIDSATGTGDGEAAGAAWWEVALLMVLSLLSAGLAITLWRNRSEPA